MSFIKKNFIYKEKSGGATKAKLLQPLTKYLRKL